MWTLLGSCLLAIAGSSLAYESVNVNVSQPQSSAPLNTTLAYYRLPGFNGEDEYLTHGQFSVSTTLQDVAEPPQASTRQHAAPTCPSTTPNLPFTGTQQAHQASPSSS